MSLILDTDTCIDVLIGATALEMNWPWVTSNLSVGQQWLGEIARTNTMEGFHQLS